MHKSHLVVLERIHSLKCRINKEINKVPLARRHTRARLFPLPPAAARCSGSGWAVTRSPDCQELAQRCSSSYPAALLHTHLTSSGCRPFLLKSCKTSSSSFFFLFKLISKEGCSRIALPLGCVFDAATVLPLTFSGQDAGMEISSKTKQNNKTKQKKTKEKDLKKIKKSLPGP